MIRVRLRVIECDVIALAQQSSPIVSLKGRLIDRDELRTPEGRDLTSREWAIRLTSDNWTGSLGGIGVASYIPELDDEEHGHDEFFSLELSTSPTTLAAVIDMARGRPSDFTVAFETNALRYGWEPDGSAVEWDCDAQQHIPVTDASFKGNLMKPVETLALEPLKPLQPLQTVTSGATVDALATAKIITLLRILILITGAGLLVLLMK